MTQTYLFLGGPDHGKELAVFPADAKQITNRDPITGNKEHLYLRRTYISATGDGASRQVFIHSSIINEQWNAISEYLFEEWVHSYRNHDQGAVSAKLTKPIPDEDLERLLEYLKLHSPWVRRAVDRERMLAQQNERAFAEEFGKANPRTDVVGFPDPGNPFGIRSVAFTADPRIADYVQVAEERIGDPRSHIMMRDRDAFGMELYVARCGVRREPYRWRTSNERVENPYQVPWCPGCLAAVGIDFKVKPYPPRETDG